MILIGSDLFPIFGERTANRKHLRILVACELSGIVRDAFIRKGHDAWSCDINPSDNGGPHIQEDALKVIQSDWDMVIAHPPCTHLASSGAQWWPRKRETGEQQEAERFFLAFSGCAPKVAIENPVGRMSKAFRPPDQKVQPWQFGDPFQKLTCLWLEGLPPLLPTEIVDRGEMVEFESGKRMPKWYADLRDLPPDERRKARSYFPKGIAEAMAQQWG
jgi:hypothetical protein